MAIRNENTETLVDSQINSKPVSDVKISTQSISGSGDSPKKSAEKQPGFIKSIFAELAKVEWPSAGYVINWSIVIVIFTVFFSLSLGFIDNIYESGIKFVACTSPEGRNLLYEDDALSSTCFSEFFKNAAYQTGQDS